jgi:hypothetical protein
MSVETWLYVAPVLITVLVGGAGLIYARWLSKH